MTLHRPDVGRPLLRRLPETAEVNGARNDDSSDAVHDGQPLRLFNASQGEYGFQLIIVFDSSGRFGDAVLRPARRPDGAKIRPHLHNLVRTIGCD